MLALGVAAYEFSKARSGGQAVGPTDAVRLMNQGALLVDVRSKAEFDARPHHRRPPRAAGRRGRSRPRRSSGFKDKVVITCCESGMRSGAAARALQGAGLHQGGQPARRPAGLARREPAARQGRRRQAEARRPPRERRRDAPDVTMYSTGWCPYCDRARGLLQRKGVAVQRDQGRRGPDAARHDAASAAAAVAPCPRSSSATATSAASTTSMRSTRPASSTSCSAAPETRPSQTTISTGTLPMTDQTPQTPAPQPAADTAGARRDPAGGLHQGLSRSSRRTARSPAVRGPARRSTSTSRRVRPPWRRTCTRSCCR